MKPLVSISWNNAGIEWRDQKQQRGNWGCIRLPEGTTATNCRGNLGHHTRQHPRNAGAGPARGARPGETGAGGAPRGLCRHLATPPGTGRAPAWDAQTPARELGTGRAPSAWDAQTSCTGTGTSPQHFPLLSGMHKPSSAGSTRNFRASQGFGECSLFVPGSHAQARKCLFGIAVSWR